jgi:hypothetical protein
MDEPSDTDGNAGGIWQGNAYICIQKGTSGSTTLATVHVADPCSNPGIKSSLIHDTCAAEVFELSPELYMTVPPNNHPNGGAPTFNSITGLPPVL